MLIENFEQNIINLTPYPNMGIRILFKAKYITTKCVIIISSVERFVCRFGGASLKGPYCQYLDRKTPESIRRTVVKSITIGLIVVD